MSAVVWYYYCSTNKNKKEKEREEIINNLKEAGKKRTQQVKEKILNAITELKKNNEEITISKVARLANVSYNTAKKYLPSLLNKQV